MKLTKPMYESRMMKALPGNRRVRTPAKTVGQHASMFLRSSGKDAACVCLVSGRVHGWIFPLFNFIFIMVFMYSVSTKAATPSIKAQPKGELKSFRPKEYYVSANRVYPLQNIREQATAEEIAAAQGVEALLIDHMIQEMRKTVPENDIIPISHGEKIFRQMMDSEYANTLARSGMAGIADQVLAEMKGKK